MKPKKILIDRAVANGSMKRLNILISAAHILNCTTNTYLEESASLLEQCGMRLGDVKKLHNMFVKAADRYFHEFATMVDEQGAKIDMFEDMESFDRVFRAWARIESNWEPIDVEFKEGAWVPVNNNENE